jgi:hypothetical protein
MIKEFYGCNSHLVFYYTMVYCELGRLPLYVERQCKMAKYWTKVMNTENCILKGCYDDMFEYSCSKPNDKQSWCCKIKEILFKHGFSINVIESSCFYV